MPEMGDEMSNAELGATADKWKALSRKNEAQAKLNLARAELAEARLQLVRARTDQHIDVIALNRQIEKNQREFLFWQQMMQAAPWMNKHSGRVRAQHRS